MKLVRGAWKILLGIKDFLVLVVLLGFFTLLFAALSYKPNPAKISDGALVIALDGSLVEQPQETDPFAQLGGGRVMQQQRLRDVLRALEGARTDTRVKAVVLDLDRFLGGYPAAIQEVGAAIGRVRATGKPVLAYASGYMDSSYALAAHASEIWTNGFGGALFTGPGGTQLYYKGLLDRLGVTTHIYKVGRYKSAVEPYERADMSPDARAAADALYGSLFAQWRDGIAKARPKARIADFLARSDAVVAGSGGDIAAANLSYGLIDKTGDRLAFGKRVAEIVGAPAGKPAGSFRTIRMANWLAANPVRASGGEAIGVITVAGELVDGTGGPGTAASGTISQLLLKGLAEKKLKALVVRIDSPGGSVTASEQVRQAVLQAKGQGLPVVVSMGGMAASGGYWVATAGDTIFAEPTTVTGSIGIFGVLPSFEQALAKIGVTSDGVRTTPLSGQPDLLGGLNPQVDRILQSTIERGYARFVGLVAQSRKLPPARVNEIAQGRVWDGGTAHQLKLVDRFGGLQAAIEEAARRANVDPAKARPVFLEQEPAPWVALLNSFGDDGGDDEWADAAASGDLFARIAGERRALLGRALGDARALATSGSVQARCLECSALAPAAERADTRSLADLLLARIWG